MAFMSMVFASLFVCLILIGLLYLLTGIILGIIWHRKKKKGKEVKRALRICTILFTVWGLIQGIGPLAFIGLMILFNS